MSADVQTRAAVCNGEGTRDTAIKLKQPSGSRPAGGSKDGRASVRPSLPEEEVTKALEKSLLSPGRILWKGN